jgi:hypothetical protein
MPQKPAPNVPVKVWPTTPAKAPVRLPGQTSKTSPTK